MAMQAAWLGMLHLLQPVCSPTGRSYSYSPADCPAWVWPCEPKSHQVGTGLLYGEDPFPSMVAGPLWESEKRPPHGGGGSVGKAN